MTDKEICAIAKEIARDLFTDYRGRQAGRLVMEIERKLDGAGWCKEAVVGRIAAELKRRLNRKAK